MRTISFKTGLDFIFADDNDDTETLFAYRLNRAAEVEAGEVVPVQQDNGMTVRLPKRRHVHIRDPQFLPIKRDRQRRGRIRDIFTVEYCRV